MPKRLEVVAIDPAKPKTLDCKLSTSGTVVQFKRTSSFEVGTPQRLCPSGGGDPGPAGFDWNELTPSAEHLGIRVRPSIRLIQVDR